MNYYEADAAFGTSGSGRDKGVHKNFNIISDLQI
jgi:hypothetical protein